MDYRYFQVTEGPLFDAFVKIVEQRRKAGVALRKFMKKHGISDTYGGAPAEYRFDLDDPANRDDKKWRKVKQRGGRFFWEARKNTPEGKALAAEVAALPVYPAFNDALDVVPGLTGGMPLVIDGNAGYRAHIRFYSMRDPKVIIVAVPWKEVDAKKLAAYKKQAASKKRNHWCHELEFAQWTPPAWMVEMKEWEALRLIDETQQGV